MQDFGQFLLFVSFFVTLATALTAVAGAVTKNERMMRGARSGLYASTLLAIAMAVVLTHGFLTHDFSNKYIASYSDRSMPTVYLLAAFWGGEKGALLFWVTSLSIFSSIAIYTKRERSPVYLSWVVAILMGAIFFFLILMVFESSPFETFMTSAGPEDGKGLNPLLQNPVMAFHPPALLTGYIMFTIPFAFGMAALISNKLDEQWISDTRRWTIVSWLFLTVGLLLGARWAYMEIGWGFWWMWDAVENAGLVPWFTATAFLHSVMIQERRGMLKRWNMVLLVLTFALTIVGTFMTRSQIIVSIHAFADSKLPGYFGVYLLIILAVGISLITWRWKALKSEARVEAFMSRESMFVLNNVLFVFCAVVLLWGTLIGKFSEWEPLQDFFGIDEPLVWDEPTFNDIFAPIGLLILLVMSIGPLISWRRATVSNFRKNFIKPLAWATIVTVILTSIAVVLELLDRQSAYGQSFGEAYGAWSDSLQWTHYTSFATYLLCAFVLFSIFREFYLGAKVRRKKTGGTGAASLLALTVKNPRRYGGYIVHIGMVFLFIAFTGKVFKTEEKDRLVRMGNVHVVEDYSITLADRNAYWDEGEGCATQQATFVVMPVRTTVDEDEVTQLATWLEGRGTGPFHIETEMDSPIMRVRFVDDAARQTLLDDFALTRALLANHSQVFASRQSRQILYDPVDTKLAQSMPFAAMQQLRSLRDALAVSNFDVKAGIQGGSLRLTLDFASEAAFDTFQKRTAQLAWGAAIGTKLVATGSNPGQRTRTFAVTDPAFEAELRDAIDQTGWGATAAPNSDAEAITLRFQDGASFEGFETAVRSVAIPPHVLALMANPELGALDIIDAATGAQLFPESRFYPRQRQATTEVAISSADFLIDVYVSMQASENPEYVKLYTVIFPLVNFLWIGGMLLVFGAVICLIPPWLSRTLVSVFSGRSSTRQAIILFAAGSIAGAGFFGLGASTARAEQVPEPYGFAAPAAGDAYSDILGKLKCACREGRKLQIGQIPMSDPACDCAQAIDDKRVIFELVGREPAVEQSSGRAKYDVLGALKIVEPSWDERFIYAKSDYVTLVNTTKNTCAGERGMTLSQSKATCSVKSTWLPRFRQLLTAGVSRADVFEYYVAENNVTQQPSAPWESYELHTLEDRGFTYTLPIGLLLGALFLLFFFVLPVRKKRRGQAQASREAQGAAGTALSARDRLILEDELEGYDL
ncbi:MAG: cytochrome c-type biogenesis protein CcmF [Myxococcota bacterium]|jgi:cytochrome c-type biogenesis protein CcmF